MRSYVKMSYKIVLWFYSFFPGEQKIFSVSCGLGFHRSQSQHISAQALHPLGKVQHVRLLCEHAGFYCEGWNCLWALVLIYQKALIAAVRPANTSMETRLYSCTLWFIAIRRRLYLYTLESVCQYLDIIPVFRYCIEWITSYLVWKEY